MDLSNALRLKVFRKEITLKNAEDQLKLF